MAQKEHPLEGDFFKLIQNDFNLINETYDENFIKSLSKRNMKKLVKKKIRKAAFDYLISEKDKKSKIKGITYKKFKLQKFLTSNLFTNYEVQLLSKLRSRNVDVKSNFKNNFRNLQCSIKNCLEIEDQQHLLRCKPVLKKIDKEQIVKL